MNLEHEVEREKRKERCVTLFRESNCVMGLSHAFFYINGMELSKIVLLQST